MNQNTEEKTEKKSLKNYWPLLSLILVAALGGCAINFGVEGDTLSWMHYFMGLLLTQFALLKIFDVPGFADGFQMYDLIAKNNRGYALAYPFIELALGLGYFSFILPVLVYSLTFLVMLVGSLGVIKALNEGLDIHCPCMGSILNVPLSTVTLSEDLGMGIMALLMLGHRIFGG